MARIAYYVHGRGRGHASRARAVLPRLRGAGHEVRVFGGGHACDVLADDPSFTQVRPCLPGRGLAGTFARRFRADWRVQEDFGPDAVVTDCDLAALHVAAARRVPTLAMGHGLIFRHTHLPEGLPRLPRWREIINAASSSWAARMRVPVHFAPVEPRTPGTRVARPDVGEDLLDGPRTDDGFVLAYFRDDNGYDALEQVVARGHRVVCFGGPQQVPDGVDLLPPSVTEFRAYLRRCRFVLASAGNHLPAECGLLGKAMLAVWAPGDAEHRMNAALIEGAGIGVAARLDQVDGDIVRRVEEQQALPDEVVASVRTMPTASEAVSGAVAELLENRT